MEVTEQQAQRIVKSIGEIRDLSIRIGRAEVCTEILGFLNALAKAEDEEMREIWDEMVEYLKTNSEIFGQWGSA